MHVVGLDERISSLNFSSLNTITLHPKKTYKQKMEPRKTVEELEEQVDKVEQQRDAAERQRDAAVRERDELAQTVKDLKRYLQGHQP